MRGRFRVVVEVIAFLALAGFAVGPEKFFELREQIRLGTEMRKMPIAGGLGLFHRLAERGAVQAVEAVTLDDLRVNLFATEDMFERAFDRGGAGAAGAGDGDDRVFLDILFLFGRSFAKKRILPQANPSVPCQYRRKSACPEKRAWCKPGPRSAEIESL